LLGYEPKDFDVVTNATPEQIHELFRNSRIIGRRFKLVHVRFGRDVIEVATYRAHYEQGKGNVDLGREGMVLNDNVYGTLEEDAWRRDFTVNALYYDIRDFSVVDFTGGLADLEAGVMRLIGDPEQRYREDPVRMLRAVRLSAKLGMKIEKQAAQLIYKMGSLLQEIPAARLFEEVLKLFMGGQAVASYEALVHYDLFQHLFPVTHEALAANKEAYPHEFIMKVLQSTDARIAADKPVTPAFLFAGLLWEPIRDKGEFYREQGEPAYQAYHLAADKVLHQVIQTVSVPRRFSTVMREIWTLQNRFYNRGGKRAASLAGHPRFRAAYDFLVLRAEVGEVDAELAQWWTNYQAQNGDGQRQIQREGGGGNGRRRRRPRKRPSGNRGGNG
jgi:poly(A) polymerase